MFKIQMEVKVISVKFCKCGANNGRTLVPLGAVQT